MTEELYQHIKGKRKTLRNACAQLSRYQAAQEREKGVYDYTSLIGSQQDTVRKLQAEYDAI
jgi:hypothetical protein